VSRSASCICVQSSFLSDKRCLGFNLSKAELSLHSREKEISEVLRKRCTYYRWFSTILGTAEIL
jgi:hypothetical protein